MYDIILQYLIAMFPSIDTIIYNTSNWMYQDYTNGEYSEYT